MDHAKQAGAQLGLPWPDEQILNVNIQNEASLFKKNQVSFGLY